VKGCKYYSHKNKVLGGFEGVWHNCKAGESIKAREKEGTKSIGCMRICSTTDGFQLSESENENISVKKSTATLTSRSSIVAGRQKQHSVSFFDDPVLAARLGSSCTSPREQNGC
jgi:hypothetical protein